MQAGDILTEQLNDPTGAPFYNLLYIPQTWVYKMVAPTYITLQYKSCSEEFRIEYMADICFWPLYMLMKLVFNFINSTRAYVYIKGNACIWLPIENRMKVNQCYVTGRSRGCLHSEKNVNCDVFEAFVRTTDIIFTLVTYRDNSRHDIHVTHMKQNVV